MEKHEHITCPSCGELFECKPGSIIVCHCSDIQLSPEQKAYLAEKWDSCLCHNCLSALKENWNEIADKAQHVVMLK